jgi:hypothetical protein
VTIGWYIHHHGNGHLRRFEAVRPHLDGVVGLSSLARPAWVPPGEWVQLELDAPAPEGSDPTAGGHLHWVPRHHAGLRARMAQLGGWLERSGADLLVSDVSVEVAAYARLMGVPVAWIAQRGVRTDAPHQLAYGLSTVLAPWSASLAGAGTGLPGSTRFLGAVSRFDGRQPCPAPGARSVLVLLGAGGHSVAAAQLAAAAAATPEWRWAVAGLGVDAPAGVHDHGRTGDVWSLLAGADVVVASAGSNVVAEVAAARRALVCLPQARPFDEQHEQAAALARAGLAETFAGWPAAGAWPEILERALARDPAAWARAHDGEGARRLAGAVAELACASG